MGKLWLILAVFLVIIGGAWAWTQTQPKNPAATTTVAVNTPKKAEKPWSGSAKRVYDVTFVNRGRALDLAFISYTGLNRPTANVYVVFTTEKMTALVPSFLNASAFQLVSPTGRAWTPQVQTTAILNQSPPYWQANLKFAQVPTQFLGAGQIQFFVQKPGGHFEIDLLPPPPPAGHAYAESKALVRPKPHKAKLPLCKKGHKSTHKHPCRKR